MQISRIFLKSSFFLFVFANAFFFPKTVFPESPSSLSMPEMPSLSVSAGPAMPSISVPTIGSKFYTPKFQQEYKIEKPNPPVSVKSEISKDMDASAILKSVDDGKTLLENQEIISVGSGKLSAMDILSMNSSGLFSNVYGLLEAGAEKSNSKNSGTLLNDIISELNGIKEQQEKSDKKLFDKNADEIVAYNQNEQKGPAILRFFVDGHNILNTCKTVYFSQKEKDGSFLLTGDRRYIADNKSRSETFYFLFKSDGKGGAFMGYNVEPAVVQDYENKNSFLYRISEETALSASKTGNLVSLRSKDSAVKIDLLLDIGE